jgi:hypothetical protein
MLTARGAMASLLPPAINFGHGSTLAASLELGEDAQAAIKDGAAFGRPAPLCFGNDLPRPPALQPLFSLRKYPSRSLQKKWQVRTDHLLALSDESSTRISTVLTLRMMLLVFAALLLAVVANVNA